jgi:hypothetical protein
MAYLLVAATHATVSYHDPFHMTLTHDDAGHVCPSFLHNCYNCSYSGLSSDGHVSMGLLIAVSIPP